MGGLYCLLHAREAGTNGRLHPLSLLRTETMSDLDKLQSEGPLLAWRDETIPEALREMSATLIRIARALEKKEGKDAVVAESSSPRPGVDHVGHVGMDRVAAELASPPVAPVEEPKRGVEEILERMTFPPNQVHNRDHIRQALRLYRAERAEHEKDYEGMREFQRKFIEADQKWRALKEEVREALRGATHTPGGATVAQVCGVCDALRILERP